MLQLLYYMNWAEENVLLLLFLSLRIHTDISFEQAYIHVILYNIGSDKLITTLKKFRISQQPKCL